VLDGSKILHGRLKAMRVAFSNTDLARAAAGVLKAYGYAATQVGMEVLTDCPPLLAVPAIAKRIGLAEIESVELSTRRAARNSEIAAFPSVPASPTADRTTAAGPASGMAA
jgi:hypothetical protein